MGLDSHFQTKVGDNLDRIVEVLELALSRSDAVICCGGLGPTQDDVTRNAIARVMGLPLESDEEMEERIVAMFAGRGRRMPSNNLRQAERPRGAAFIREQPGTAPGLICPVSRPSASAGTGDGGTGEGGTGETVEKVVYAVPGVPWEMQEMLLGTVLPDLQHRAGLDAVIRSRTLRTWGESESGLAELLAERIYELDRVGNPTIAFLASGMEGLKVRITAKCPTVEEAQAVLAGEEERLRSLLGPLGLRCGRRHHGVGRPRPPPGAGPRPWPPPSR